jgi:hypothetical protein
MKPDIKEIANTIIRGEKAITFPLKINGGTWISDANGHHILDIRGWGFIQYLGEGAEELQDAIANWVVETLNKDWENANKK